MIKYFHPLICEILRNMCLVTFLQNNTSKINKIGDILITSKNVLYAYKITMMTNPK